MAEYFTLSCPSCGGKLQLTKDIERFACEHCGNEHIVRRAGGVVTLTAMDDKLQHIRSGVDRTSSELAIQRLEREIEQLAAEATYERRRIDAIYQDIGLLGGILAVMGRKRQDRDAAVAPFREAIRQRQLELEKHRKIVAG